eukprot:m.95508 g.95508  ORF g.95508 m.95508 type:complete len:1052 (+) comp13496_c0_seq2:288-3443(+)
MPTCGVFQIFLLAVVARIGRVSAEFATCETTRPTGKLAEQLSKSKPCIQDYTSKIGVKVIAIPGSGIEVLEGLWGVEPSRKCLPETELGRGPIVSVVRNPFTRMVENFEQELQADYKEKLFHRGHLLKFWMRNVWVNILKDYRSHIRPQALFLTEGSASSLDCKAHYILRYEHLETDYKALQEKVTTLPTIDFSKFNPTPFPIHWCKYYHNDVARQALELFKIDFELFKDLYSSDITTYCRDHPYEDKKYDINLPITQFEGVQGQCTNIGILPTGPTANRKCFDVNTCAQNANVGDNGKYAIVLSHSLENVPRPGNPRFNVESLRSFVTWQQDGIDVVLLVPACPPGHLKQQPNRDYKMCEYPGHTLLANWNNGNPRYKQLQYIHPLSQEELQILKFYNVKVQGVPWLVPPETSPNVGGCGGKDLIRLNVFNQTQYDAVIYYDWDVFVNGDLKPLFKCAHSGEFMMASGALAYLNAGFMALRPSHDLMELVLYFSKHAKFDLDPTHLLTVHGGWGEGSAWPNANGANYPGFECGQGYLWTLIFGNGLGVEYGHSEVAREAHAKFPKALPRPGRILDRCLYNYQRDRGSGCAPGFTCKNIVAIHKAYEPGKGAGMCAKPDCAKDKSSIVCQRMTSVSQAPKYDPSAPPVPEVTLSNPVVSKSTEDVQEPQEGAADSKAIAQPQHKYDPDQVKAFGVKVYMYNLDDSFRDNGNNDCSASECAFGEAKVVDGMNAWHSRGENMAWMLYTRLLNSGILADNPSEADVLFVPTWSSQHEECPSQDKLVSAITKENPALNNETAKKHILIDPRVHNSCPYMAGYLPGAMSLFTRISPEADMQQRKKTKSSEWFSFPLSTVYHGASKKAPAIARPKGQAKYLWTYTGKASGTTLEVDKQINLQCEKSKACYPIKPDMKNSDYTEVQLANMAMNSTFCVYPPGSGASRKGLVDSMVLGCIPVFFMQHQLSMYRAHVSPLEFGSMAVRLSTSQLPGSKALQEIGEVAPSLDAILGAIAQEDLVDKQENLAVLAPRFVLAADTDSNDALAIFLRRVKNGQF